MSLLSFIPVVSKTDIDHVVYLIQTAYTLGQDASQQRKMQQELFQAQKRYEAWGLVGPLLDHPDPNVQFFGAHTLQIKIARDWESFPKDHVQDLRNSVLQICAQCVATHKSRVTLRKLFVAITSLALKLVPGHPSQWPDWILSVMTILSGGGARPEYVLEFLEIAVEEYTGSDLVSTSRAQLQQTIMDAIPLVLQASASALTREGAFEAERHSAFKCLEAWIPQLRADDLTSLIPTLIGLLSNEASFVGASDVLQEILTSSSLSDGAGTKTLTEPLLDYLQQGGVTIVQQVESAGFVDEIGHSLCKLLIALGEHSISYLSMDITTVRVQTFLKLVFAFTTLPGYYGLDEEESEMTMSFWYLLQESLWSTDFPGQTDEDQWKVVHELYRELVVALKRKVTWPPRSVLSRWSKDQRDKFQVYRRDVGDTLINAYYILRKEMFRPFLEEITQRLATRSPQDGWEDIEATLHCMSSVQEAVELSENPYLESVFAADILGRLPTTGHDRVRSSALSLIGTYASWFTIYVDNRMLLNVVDYVVKALDEPSLCLTAANALRDLCDTNRTKLAAHIGAFGQLHSRLESIPDSERTKVVQSISSVIQALPPEDEIQPIEAIVSPVIAKLAHALNSAGQLPEEARAVAIMQLQTLTGCAKGLTRTSDVLFALDESDAAKDELEKLNAARMDPRVIQIRDSIIQGIQGTMASWLNDASTADALSDLFKSITALPADMTLISLPPGPLLSLVCGAIQREPNAVWLSLASMFVSQLDPPSLLSSRVTIPAAEARGIVLDALPRILDPTLQYFQQEEVMEANPDIVQSFFGCMEMVVQHFARLFFEISQDRLDALMACAVRSLALQERYSLVSACTFLVSLLHRTVPTEPLAPLGRALFQRHGPAILRALLCGISGVAPSSTTQNLVELLCALNSRCSDECRVWVPEVLFAPDFIASKASKEAKERFAKAIIGSRSTKRTREAAQQFALIAKGLEGSSFGYASVSM